MNVIIIKERLAGKNAHSALLIEDNGTDDGGRIVARFTRYEDAALVCKRMKWTITDDEFLNRMNFVQS